MSLAALVLAVLALADRAHEAAGAQTSLVLAKWAGYENDRMPPGCDAPQAICIDVMADVRFVDVETISGPTLPRRFEAVVVFHTPPSEGRVVLAVQKRGGGLTGHILGGMSDEEACVPYDYATDLHVILPGPSRRVGDRVCFSAR